MQTLPLLGGVGAIPSDEASSLFLPPALRPFVATQAMDRYTAEDQAVWRFVLLQLQAELLHTAVPQFATGTSLLAIGADQVADVDSIDQKLQSFGWRAVCVDGFLPPQVFQAFQAQRVLPIARAIRSAAQLPYTPAPDILHEAVGHAPLLVDPLFAGYIQRMGEVASTAFSNPMDNRVDRAVRTLSDLEEAAEPDPHSLREARDQLLQAHVAQAEVSEAVRLARLFWWTAEYGLVGTAQSYKLYGAGLLSSLGESRSCHEPTVQKLPLTARCTDVSFDITRPQPQLFVARDLEHLYEVLEEVEQTLVTLQGGHAALLAAVASRQVVSVSTSLGLRCVGQLQALENTSPKVAVQLAAGGVLAWGSQVLGQCSEPLIVPWGLLAKTQPCVTPDGRRHYRFASGLVASGRPLVVDSPVPWWIPLAEFQLGYPGHAPLITSSQYPLLLAGEVQTARPASACDPCASPVLKRMATPAQFNSPAAWNGLYRRVRNLSPHACTSSFRALYAMLRRTRPHDWLLHWSLLERLQRFPHGQQVAQCLRDDLVNLEKAQGENYPIAAGLQYLQTVNRRGGYHTE